MSTEKTYKNTEAKTKINFIPNDGWIIADVGIREETETGIILTPGSQEENQKSYAEVVAVGANTNYDLGDLVGKTPYVTPGIVEVGGIKYVALQEHSIMGKLKDPNAETTTTKTATSNLEITS